MKLGMPRTRVLGYARISPNPDEGDSIENQIEKIKAYCIATDLELVGIHVDNLKSAKSLERDGLQAAFDALDAGKADGLLVVKLDRLTRNVRDMGALIESRFEKHSLHCIALAVDTRTASGRLVLHVLTAFAQMERETTIERTKDALAHLKRKGVKLGTIAYGKRRVRTTEGERCEVQVDPAEAEAVALIVELHDAGDSVRKIAERLNADGIAPRRGGKRAATKWHATQVQRVLARSRAGA